jgi:adenylate cyclase
MTSAAQPPQAGAFLEVEVAYLAASLPPGLEKCPREDMIDIYFPDTVEHPKLRIRQKGDSYELTKKTQADPNDAGAQYEENVALTADEFAALAKGHGRKVAKTRYFLPYGGRTAEVDVFSGPLQGLVIIEIEFETVAERDSFAKPDFCSADVTQVDFIAGGMLAGKSYRDIEAQLKRLGYKAL